MTTKYGFTNNSQYYAGRKLQRIQRLSDGKIGGWIESEYNLSHEGDCWVDDEAIVYDNATVQNSAKVIDNAIITDNAYVYNKALITKHTIIGESTCVKAGTWESPPLFIRGSYGWICHSGPGEMSICPYGHARFTYKLSNKDNFIKDLKGFFYSENHIYEYSLYYDLIKKKNEMVFGEEQDLEKQNPLASIIGEML